MNNFSSSLRGALDDAAATPSQRPRTSTAGCTECGKTNHEFKKCPRHLPDRRNCSRTTYIFNEKLSLKRHDVRGYAAAGYLFLHKDGEGKTRVLLSNENRERCGEKFNFIGGKRRKVSDKPEETAWRKFLEETSVEEGKPETSFIPKETLKLLEPLCKKCNVGIFDADSKYVVYIVRLDDDTFFECKETWSESILVWARVDTLGSDECHDFTWQLFQHLRNQKSKDWFESF